jgi:hypothetical protein
MVIPLTINNIVFFFFFDVFSFIKIHYIQFVQRRSCQKRSFSKIEARHPLIYDLMVKSWLVMSTKCHDQKKNNKIIIKKVVVRLDLVEGTTTSRKKKIKK